MLGLQEYNGVCLWSEQLSPHLPPFTHKGAGRAVQEENVRGYWFWGTLVQQCQKQPTDCPFMEPLKEFPVWGCCFSSWEHPLGGWVEEEGTCLQGAAHSGNTRNQPRARGGDTPLYLFCASYLAIYSPFFHMYEIRQEKERRLNEKT